MEWRGNATSGFCDFAHEIPFPTFALVLQITSSRKPSLHVPRPPEVGVVISEDTHSPTPTLAWEPPCLGHQHLLLASSGVLGTDRTTLRVPGPGCFQYMEVKLNLSELERNLP